MIVIINGCTTPHSSYIGVIYNFHVNSWSRNIGFSMSGLGAGPLQIMMSNTNSYSRSFCGQFMRSNKHEYGI